MSGQLWVIDLTEQAGIGSRTTPYWGWQPDRPLRRVWVQRLIHGEEWEDDRAHLRRAYELATEPDIAASPHILRVLDLIHEWDTYLVSEFAETTLDKVLHNRSLALDEAKAVEDALLAALGVLHEAGLVHSDVREDNVFRVEGMWKLGDLGGVVKVEAPIVALQKEREYVPDGIQLGSPAKQEYDQFALEVVLRHLGNP